MAEGFGELRRFGASLQSQLSAINQQAARRIGEIGVDEVNRAASNLWGSDRKFSGAHKGRGSKKARRAATVRYRVSGDTVDIYPGGDPWYITMKGRGRKLVEPRARTRGRPRKGKQPRRALRFSDGEFRVSVVAGRMAPRPQILDPPARRISNRAGLKMSDAVSAAIRRAL